jgi:hypothetical protein
MAGRALRGELIVIELKPWPPEALTALHLGNVMQLGADGSTALHNPGPRVCGEEMTSAKQHDPVEAQ